VRFEVRGFTALLGASGAGKTSLLKALAGLVPGSGSPWNGLPAAMRPVGYLPQGSGLFPHLSVLENVAFALRGKPRLAKAQALLDTLGIGHLAARNAAKISGGEAQLVALARALARPPELLLLDEPSAALDAATRDGVLARLIERIDASGVPALAATHDPAIAMLADWLVLLADGGIVQQGTPRELFNLPRSVAAAKLVQNFWVEDGRSFCIRAEDVEIYTDNGNAARCGGAPRPTVRAVVIGVREQGADLQLRCMAPMPVTVRVRNGDKSRFAVGRTVWLGFPDEKLRVFPPQ
jgi:molybdate transport system ATP-binding protein